MVKAKNNQGKKGQITIIAIIAVAIVIGIGVAFFVIPKAPEIATGKAFNPQSYIEQCTKKYTEEAVDLMLPRGGFIEPKSSAMFENVNATFLCENVQYYYPCINQHPMLINEMNNEIKNYVQKKIEQCFNDLKTEVEKRSGKMDVKAGEVEAGMGPNRISLIINKRTTIDFGGEITTIEKFPVSVVSPLYNLGQVAMEIASQEAKYCNFLHDGYMILYPWVNIKKTELLNSVTVYSIKDKKSQKTFNIAIRSCAIPAGI